MGRSSSGRPAPSLVSSSMNESDESGEEGTSRKFMASVWHGVEVSGYRERERVSSTEPSSPRSPSGGLISTPTASQPDSHHAWYVGVGNKTSWFLLTVLCPDSCRSYWRDRDWQVDGVVHPRRSAPQHPNHRRRHHRKTGPRSVRINNSKTPLRLLADICSSFSAGHLGTRRWCPTLDHPSSSPPTPQPPPRHPLSDPSTGPHSASACSTRRRTARC